MNSLIQVNKLAELHDGENIFFCKTDFLQQTFKEIQRIPHDVTLITGNSDYPIIPEWVALAPKNIKHWFCVNPALVSESPKITGIPLGIENSEECVLQGHGVGWEHAKEKVNCLLKVQIDQKPTKLAYSNFKTSTNLQARQNLELASNELDWITWKNPDLPYWKMCADILDHEATFCPVGNGMDTHRFWEVQYLDRIPILINNPLVETLYSKLTIPYIHITEPDQFDEDFDSSWN